MPEPAQSEPDDKSATATSTLVDTVQPSIGSPRETPASESASKTEPQTGGAKITESGDSPTEASTSEPSETTVSESMQTNSTPSQANTAPSTDEQDPSDDTATIEIDAAVHKLAQRHADADDVSLSAFTRQALDAYLSALLRGEEPWSDAPSADHSVDLETGPALGELLSIAATEQDVDDVESFVLAHLRDVVGLESETESLELPEQGSVLDYLDAVVENEATPHDTRRTVVQAALERRVLS
jgi:predicted HicB family RNase H-like nuclease